MKTGWPASWGAPPDWTQTLLDHAPYVALNRVHVMLRSSLRTLGLAQYHFPVPDEALKTAQEIEAALQKDKHLIAEIDVAGRFLQEMTAIQAAVQKSLDDGHALVNGKWLVEVFAPGRTGKRAKGLCLTEWTSHATSAGGLAEVRDLWARITGRPL